MKGSSQLSEKDHGVREKAKVGDRETNVCLFKIDLRGGASQAR